MTSRHVHLKKTIEGMYKPYRKHPVLFDFNNDADQKRIPTQWIHPDLLEIIEHFQNPPPKSTTEASAAAGAAADNTSNITTTDQQQQLPKPLRKEMDGVYSFMAFSNEFVTLFNEEIDNFYKMSELHNIPIRRPNSMNNYGVVVNEIGLRPFITNFQQNYIWPLSSRLFPKQYTRPKFDDHHSFIVRYQAGEDLGLDMHTDDSDITFNVCLGEPGFKAATLTFCGMFGAADHRQFTHKYHHEIGRAILHLGTRRHGADDIAEGKRINLIIWNHNWYYRSSDQYKMTRIDYQKEIAPPSEVCLSYTHDVDYFAYKEIPQRAQDLDLHPWCPPLGYEYDGFDDKIKSQDKKTTKKKSSRDPLDGEL